MSSKSRKVTIDMITIGTKTSCTTELAQVTTQLTGALKTQSQTLHYNGPAPTSYLTTVTSKK